MTELPESGSDSPWPDSDSPAGHAYLERVMETGYRLLAQELEAKSRRFVPDYVVGDVVAPVAKRRSHHRYLVTGIRLSGGIGMAVTLAKRLDRAGRMLEPEIVIREKVAKVQYPETA